MKKKKFRQKLLRVVVSYVVGSPAYETEMDALRKKCTKRQMKRVRQTIHQVMGILHEEAFTIGAITRKAKRSL